MQKHGSKVEAQRLGDAREPALATDSCTRARMHYTTPQLTALGDLRDLTLGGSVGRADSGAPTRQARVGGI